MRKARRARPPLVEYEMWFEQVPHAHSQGVHNVVVDAFERLRTADVTRPGPDPSRVGVAGPPPPRPPNRLGRQPLPVSHRPRPQPQEHE
jgi:hypothetical protein